MIDIACLIVVGIVTWMVASEGIWSGAQTFLCTLISALLAMNFFEPLAIRLRGFGLPDEYCDIVALLGLFIGLEFGIRLGAEQISPRYISVYPMLDSMGRWAFGVITGYLTMAFLLTALHTAPLPREFMGFQPERNNFFNMAPDRQWLGFMQYVSEKSLAVLMSDKIGEKTILVARAFDGHYEKVGDPAKPYTIKDQNQRDVYQLIWPSFPIRYAMRREKYSGSGSAASAATSSAPPPQTQPAAPYNPAAPAQNVGF